MIFEGKLEEKEKSVKTEVIEEVELSQVCMANKGDRLEEFEVLEDVNQVWDVVKDQEEGRCDDIKEEIEILEPVNVGCVDLCIRLDGQKVQEEEEEG